MDELDKLKNHWKKNDETFPKVSESDIYAMLHKRSSSIVKWILIISILELVFWTICSASGGFMGAADYQLPKILTVLDYVNFAVLTTFVILFYINYRKISAEKPVKELLKNIITMRRIVRTYVVYIISVVLFTLVFALVFYENEFNDAPNHAAILVVSIFVVLIIIAIAIFVYNMLYGRLLRKLNKNYKELEKINNQ